MKFSPNFAELGILRNLYCLIHFAVPYSIYTHYLYAQIVYNCPYLAFKHTKSRDGSFYDFISASQFSYSFMSYRIFR